MLPMSDGVGRTREKLPRAHPRITGVLRVVFALATERTPGCPLIACASWTSCTIVRSSRSQVAQMPATLKWKQPVPYHFEYDRFATSTALAESIFGKWHV